jgi:hypothetical protein
LGLLQSFALEFPGNLWISVYEFAEALDCDLPPRSFGGWPRVSFFEVLGGVVRNVTPVPHSLLD